MAIKNYIVKNLWDLMKIRKFEIQTFQSFEQEFVLLNFLIEINKAIH